MSAYMYANTHIYEGTYLTSTVSLRLSLTGDSANIHFAQTSSKLKMFNMVITFKAGMDRGVLPLPFASLWENTSENIK